jgi:hypothetical protein
MVGTLTKGHLPWVVPVLAPLMMNAGPLNAQDLPKQPTQAGSNAKTVVIEDQKADKQVVPVGSLPTIPKLDRPVTVVKLSQPTLPSNLKPQGAVNGAGKPSSSSTKMNLVKDVDAAPTVLVTQSSTTVPQGVHGVLTLPNKPTAAEVVRDFNIQIKQDTEDALKLLDNLPPLPGTRKK